MDSYLEENQGGGEALGQSSPPHWPAGGALAKDSFVAVRLLGERGGGRPLGEL